MDQLNQLKAIISITESIIEDQKLVKRIAQNLLQETKELEAKHDELKDILSQTQQLLVTTTHIPIDTINILAKEVNDQKAEQEKQWQSLQCLLDHVHVKTNHQRNFCNENKETDTHSIKKNVNDDTNLTNGVNSSNTSLHSTFDFSSITSNNIPQENIAGDPCPLRFDTLVDYFETRESNGQQEGNNSGFINQSKVFNAKNGELHTFRNMKFSSKMQKNLSETLNCNFYFTNEEDKSSRPTKRNIYKRQDPTSSEIEINPVPIVPEILRNQKDEFKRQPILPVETKDNIKTETQITFLVDLF